MHAGRNHTDKVRPKVQSKKTKVRLKASNVLYITKRTEKKVLHVP